MPTPDFLVSSPVTNSFRSSHGMPVIIPAPSPLHTRATLGQCLRPAMPAPCLRPAWTRVLRALDTPGHRTRVLPQDTCPPPVPCLCPAAGPCLGHPADHPTERATQQNRHAANAARAGAQQQRRRQSEGGRPRLHLSRSPPQAPRCSMQPRATVACTLQADALVQERQEM